MNIDTEKTFDNFAVGKSNEFAYKVCKAVTANLNKYGHCLNPILIFGDTGLGKTHLLNAICNQINKNDADIKITYITAEEFTNEFLSSLASRNRDEFEDKFKNNTDILIMDDFQFISGKQQTQEQFYHIINTLLENKKQIILTTKTKPCNITDIGKTLYYRLSSGLIAEITHPEFEIRYKIVKNTAKKFDIDIPEDVVEYLAIKITSNIFQLQGITNNICLNCSLCNLQPTVKLAEEAINRIIG